MYVTYENLIQIELFLVTLIGLVYKITSDNKDKNNPPLCKSRRLFLTKDHCKGCNLVPPCIIIISHALLFCKNHFQQHMYVLLFIFPECCGNLRIPMV